MQSHLAPRRVLCVVLVTRSACSKGEGMALAATSPLMCAMSASRYAFTSSHTWGREAWGVTGCPCPHSHERGATALKLPQARELPSPGMEPTTMYLLHASVVDEAGVRTGAGDDEARTKEPRCYLQLVVVNQPRGWLQGTDRQTSCRGTHTSLCPPLSTARLAEPQAPHGTGTWLGHGEVMAGDAGVARPPQGHHWDQQLGQIPPSPGTCPPRLTSSL